MCLAAVRSSALLSNPLRVYSAVLCLLAASFVVSVSETFHLSFHLRTTTYQHTIGKAYSVIIIACEFINNNYNTKLGNSKSQDG